MELFASYSWRVVRVLDYVRYSLLKFWHNHLSGAELGYQDDRVSGR